MGKRYEDKMVSEAAKKLRIGNLIGNSDTGVRPRPDELRACAMGDQKQVSGSERTDGRKWKCWEKLAEMVKYGNSGCAGRLGADQTLPQPFIISHFWRFVNRFL